MKKLTQHNFTANQKRQLSQYLEDFITKVFTNPLKTKAELLPRLAAFAKDNTNGELVLKQSIMKGTFSQATWEKQDIINQTGVAKQIVTSHPKEPTDVRFFSELITANTFYTNEEGTFIKRITFNSEKPSKGTMLVSRGNLYKDITVDVAFINNEKYTLEVDIKIGNNGTSDIFSGTLCPYPYKTSYEHHTIVNDAIPLDFIQLQRLKHLQNIANKMSNIDKSFADSVARIGVTQSTVLDPITMNNLIQKELLICISLNVLHKQPSFFATYHTPISPIIFNVKFHEKLEPYMKPNIFDNKENFNRFIWKALSIYNESVAEISKNIHNSIWKGTGFEHIVGLYDEIS